MALGRLIERLFVQVRTDLSQLSGELASGVAQTQTATQKMAKHWTTVSTSIENLTTDLQKGLITQGQYMAQLNRHASAVSKLGGNYRQAQKQAHGYAAQLRQAARVLPIAMNTRPIQSFTRSAGMARMQMMNLGFQINDIGSTLATGMNPFTVMVQQGSQILQIYAGQGGVKTALGDISKMLIGIGKRVWPLAVIAAGFKLIQREINKTSSTSVSFMDTTKAVFQVVGRNIWKLIGGPVKGLGRAFTVVLDFIVDQFKLWGNGVIGLVVGVVKTIGVVIPKIPVLFQDALKLVYNVVVDTVELIINAFLLIPNAIGSMLNLVIAAMNTGMRGIGVIWENLPILVGNGISAAVNGVVGGVEKMINAAVKGLNLLLKGLQSLSEFVGADKALEFFGFSGKVPLIPEIKLPKAGGGALGGMKDVGTELGKIAGEEFSKEFFKPLSVGFEGVKATYSSDVQGLASEITKIFNESLGTDFLGGFFNDVKAQAIENALKRVADGVEDVGGAAKKAADEVKKMMEQLDKQLTTAADNLAQVFGNAFERLAETGRFTFGDFVKDLNRLIIKSTSELLQEELSNMFKTLAKSRGGLGSLFSNIFTGLFGGGSGVGARARGGVEMPWRSFVAGEEGPELISQDGPSGARRVTTAGQTRSKAMGGGQMQPVVVMNIQTPDVDGFRQSQGQLASRMSMFLARGRRNE